MLFQAKTPERSRKLIEAPAPVGESEAPELHGKNLRYYSVMLGVAELLMIINNIAWIQRQVLIKNKDNLGKI